jgi:protein-tyrosine phosphatase
MITLAHTRYVLLELPEAFMPATMPTVLFEAGAAGYYPILAHPERCEPFHDDVPRLEALAAGRALIQVSFRSLAGTFGRTIKRTAWTLVEEGRELPKIVGPVLEELHRRVSTPKLARLLSGTPNRLLTAE